MSFNRFSKVVDEPEPSVAEGRPVWEVNPKEAAGKSLYHQALELHRRLVECHEQLDQVIGVTPKEDTDPPDIWGTAMVMCQMQAMAADLQFRLNYIKERVGKI